MSVKLKAVVKGDKLVVSMHIPGAKKLYGDKGIGLLLVPVSRPAGGIKRLIGEKPVASTGHPAWKVPAKYILGDSVVKYISLTMLARHLPEAKYGFLLVVDDGTYKTCIFPQGNRLMDTDMSLDLPALDVVFAADMLCKCFSRK